MNKHHLIYIALFFTTLLFPCSISATAISEPNTEIPVTEGIYSIASSIENNMVMEVDDALKEPGANIQLGSYTGSSSQHFVITKKYDGWYSIRNINSQLNLDVAGSNPDPQANLHQWIDYNNDAQSFKFYDLGNGCLAIKSKLGTYVDLANGDLTPDTNIQLFHFNGTSGQIWKLFPISNSLVPADIKDGTYTISDLSHIFSMDVTSASKISGENIILSKNNKRLSQQYIIKKGRDGWYTIKNKFSHLYLTVTYIPDDNIYVLQQQPGSGDSSQKFKFYTSNTNNGLYIFSKYGNTVTSIKPSIKLDVFSESDNQLWSLKQVY